MTFRAYIHRLTALVSSPSSGWPKDMTWEHATAFASSDCVRQNSEPLIGGIAWSSTASADVDLGADLDYLQSNLNGWMQGLDGNSVRTIKNLDNCG